MSGAWNWFLAMDPRKYNDLKTDILIIGAGASGLMAAIIAARENKDIKITVLERHSIAGRKLLATGNGTCNISNIKASSEYCGEYYHSTDMEKTGRILNELDPEKTMRFFMELGIICSPLADGRIYPQCRQAYAVRNALEREAVRLGVNIFRKTEVIGIRRCEKGFSVECAPSPVKDHKDRTGTIKSYVDKVTDRLRLDVLAKGEITSSLIILSPGGKASPSLSSDGSGYSLAVSLGHSITDIYPAIVRLKTVSSLDTDISGIRLDASLILNDVTSGKSTRAAYEEGEILFTDKGISGPAALQISGAVKPGKKYRITADLMSSHSVDQLKDIFTGIRKTLGDVPASELFDGMFPSKLSAALSAYIFAGNKTMRISGMTDEDISRAISIIKSLPFDVTGAEGWEEAQITSGGIPLAEINEYTMESKICKNLYLAGEILDAAGMCGGFNLQLAWSCGYIAGRSAANRLLT